MPGESGVDEDVPRWATLKECVWKAPHHILSKHNLEDRYRAQLEGADERLAILEQFFQTTLGIADWSFAIDDMIVELSELRRAESIEEDVRESSALNCYKRMDDILGKGTTLKVEVERLRLAPSFLVWLWILQSWLTIFAERLSPTNSSFMCETSAPAVACG